MIERFNIRVYGIVINDSKQVLLTEEAFGGIEFTKFPGGGLEYSEGILECLHREFKEELGIKIEILEHFYTTEDFIQSAFRKADQLISIYYRVELLASKERLVEIHEKHSTEAGLVLKWVNLSDIDSNLFRFPIDKRVANMLRESGF